MTEIEESSTPYLAWVEACFQSVSAPKAGRTGGLWVTVCCPIHGDKNPSMGIEITKGNAFCHTPACGWKGPVKKLADEANLPTNLLPKNKRGRPAGVSSIGGSITTYYPYYDLTGQPLLRVKRIDYPDKPKDIYQEHWHKGAWVDGGPDELSLYNLQSVIRSTPDTPILFVEGEKKAQHGIDRELVCTCAPGGAGKAARVPAKYWEAFKGRPVCILPDEDESGHKHAREVAALLQDAGARCKIVKLPDLPRKGDLEDWLVLPKRAEDVLAICDQAAWLGPVTAQPTIYFEEDMDLVSHVSQANKALARWNNPPRIFKQGAAMVRLKAGDDGRSVPDTVTKEALFLYAAESAKWVLVKRAESKKGVQEYHSEIYPNKDVIMSMHHHPDPPVPVLNRIVRCPVFVGDGRILRTAGFDPGSGVLYEPDPCFKDLKIPTTPTKEQVDQARSLIADQFLGDYPWHDKASLSHAFAMLLTPFLRDMFTLVPFFFVNATVPRSGKTKLVKCISLIHTGTGASTLTYILGEEELRKRLTSQLKAMPSILLIDNVPKDLKSATLAAMATMEHWEDRELSRSLALRIPIRCIVVGTGNNTSFSPEICKRIIHMRVQHKCAKPEERTDFKILNLEEWVLRHRRELVAACLTLLNHWFASGRPVDTMVRFGGFEQWSTHMAGLLQCIGVPGFLSNVDEVADQADDETQRIEVFVDAWRDAFGSDEVSAADLQGRLKGSQSEHVQAMLRGDTDRSQIHSLGQALKRCRGRMIGGYFVHTRLKRGVSLYRLDREDEEKVKDDQPQAQGQLDVIGDMI